MSSLKLIAFYGNNLSGILFPDIYTNLHNLEELYLSENWFTGHLPPSLWRLKKLRKIGLSDNKFIGSIPSEVANLTQLTHLYLGSNRLTGMLLLSSCI
ncbi:putative non-specific serine/threonine protein kinase [Helianthus anomalus]